MESHSAENAPLPLRNHGDAVDSAAGTGRRRQDEVYRAGVYGRRPRVPTTARGLQRLARRKLNARAYSYVAGGAGEEATQRANRAAFDRWAVITQIDPVMRPPTAKISDMWIAT